MQNVNKLLIKETKFNYDGVQETILFRSRQLFDNTDYIAQEAYPVKLVGNSFFQNQCYDVESLEQFSEVGLVNKYKH